MSLDVVPVPAVDRCVIDRIVPDQVAFGKVAAYLDTVEHSVYQTVLNYVVGGTVKVYSLSSSVSAVRTYFETVDDYVVSRDQLETVIEPGHLHPVVVGIVARSEPDIQLVGTLFLVPSAGRADLKSVQLLQSLVVVKTVPVDSDVMGFEPRISDIIVRGSGMPIIRGINRIVASLGSVKDNALIEGSISDISGRASGAGYFNRLAVDAGIDPDDIAPAGDGVGLGYCLEGIVLAARA